MFKQLTITMIALISLGSSALMAQDSSARKTSHHATSARYTCSMHPDVSRSKPGKCPTCGMALVKIVKPTAMYVCPMHPDVTSDKPGKCPKCEMKLEKKKPAAR